MLALLMMFAFAGVGPLFMIVCLFLAGFADWAPVHASCLSLFGLVASEKLIPTNRLTLLSSQLVREGFFGTHLIDTLE